MARVDLGYFRQRLDRLREELEAVAEESESATSTVELDQARVGRLSRMDAMQAQSMAQETARRRQRQLARIEGALRRLESGDYGECLNCGEAIDPARLEFDPTTTRCIACMESGEAS